MCFSSLVLSCIWQQPTYEGMTGEACEKALACVVLILSSFHMFFFKVLFDTLKSSGPHLIRLALIERHRSHHMLSLMLHIIQPLQLMQ
jgi:hypothetical protein